MVATSLSRHLLSKHLADGDMTTGSEIGSETPPPLVHAPNRAGEPALVAEFLALAGVERKPYLNIHTVTALSPHVQAGASTASQTRLLAVDGGQIAYDDTGGNGPLVLAIPGMGDLRSEYRLLRPEL